MNKYLLCTILHKTPEEVEKMSRKDAEEILFIYSTMKKREALEWAKKDASIKAKSNGI